MKSLICIVCPRGCHLAVDEEHDYAVSGQGCARGEAYGKAEATHPVRILTSTVPIEGARYNRCPVKTAAPIPRECIFPAKALLKGVRLVSPVKAGQVVAADVCGTGVSIIATRDL
jgi:CxxC motif-containing protein